jgi:lysophospholipase L1-like esterase
MGRLGMSDKRLLGALAGAGIVIAVAGVMTYVLLTRQAWRQLPQDRTHPVLYVALGDSTVQGVGASDPTNNYVSRLGERLRSVYPRTHLVNLGASGATAADVRDGQLQRAVALRPDLVTLSVGPNDITRKRTAQQFEQDIETILRTLTRGTDAVIVVNLLPDLTVTPRFLGRGGTATVDQAVLAFNGALSRQARAHGAEVVDLYGPSRQEVPQHPEFIAADGYHPSDQGYARWAELMWQGVEARIGR